jgi:aminoglycoside phosphotransferase (APT) family kinase protein
MLSIEKLSAYGRNDQFRSAMCIPLESDLHFVPLGRGEYNLNYLFIHPGSGQKLVLRLNTGSQMHLQDQIGYEYRALKLLERSGRTPKVYYVDGSRGKLPYGLLVMEFLPGRALNYHTDTALAAACLADIHAAPVPAASPLLRPARPLDAILAECRGMFQVYRDSPAADEALKKRLLRLLDRGESLLSGEVRTPAACITNTELNSGNFLINGEGRGNYLIDWEKPLLSDPAQDLGHFLAPTTTNWKTDVILTPAQREIFLADYLRALDDRLETGDLFRRVRLYIAANCLRGLTWCSMAWVEYQKARRIKNAFTYKKIQSYLQKDFIDRIEEEYFNTLPKGGQA